MHCMPRPFLIASFVTFLKFTVLFLVLMCVKPRTLVCCILRAGDTYKRALHSMMCWTHGTIYTSTAVYTSAGRGGQRKRRLNE